MKFGFNRPSGFRGENVDINSYMHTYTHIPMTRSGTVARAEASSLGMQAAPSSIPTSDTFFRGNLVMKTKFFLRFTLIHSQDHQCFA